MRRISNRRGEVALSFWVLIGLVCLVVAVGAYQIGKNWVGRQLESTILGHAHAVKSQDATPGGEHGATSEAKELPPANVKVEMEPRAPTQAEKDELSAAELGQPGAQNSAATEATPVTPEASASGSGGYTVTAGSFQSSKAAEAIVADLKQRGYSPVVTDIEQRGVTYHRVVVGIYGNREKADAVRAELQQAGFAAGVSHR